MNSVLHEKWKHWRFLFICLFVFSCCTFFSLMSNGLVNSDDGIWEYNHYLAGKWSIQCGRFVWPYLDRLRMGISPEPITTLISLGLYTIGVVAILDLFNMKNRGLISFLTGTLFLSSVSVCITLSYRFMSPTFALAFVFSVAAVLLIVRIKNRYLGAGAAGIAIGLSMGLYQAFIGCTCLLLLIYLVIQLFDEKKSLKGVFTDIVCGLGAGILGAVIYSLGLKLHLTVFHLAMSDYNGGNEYSLLQSLKVLPASVINCYTVFKRYFFDNYFKINLFQDYYVLHIFFAFTTILILIELVRLFRKEKLRALFALILLILLPVASNAVLLIATSAWVSLQMTAAMALIPSVVVILLLSVKRKHEIKWIKKALCVLMVFVVFYGNFYQVQIDQEAMRSGIQSTKMIASEVTAQLIDMNLWDESLVYCFFGNPGQSSMYRLNKVSLRANMYSLFGSWKSRDYNCSRRSWEGSFHYLLGENIEIGSLMDYQKIIDAYDIDAIPSFPKQGSIYRYEDIVVIKISD